MFGLIRRISGSVIPRPDRPWEEDATSNAPKLGRKRRRSSTDKTDAVEAAESVKRARGDTPLTQDEPSTSALPTADSEGVKEVTRGVKEVELEDDGKKTQEDNENAVASGFAPELLPESVPLPEEVAGELDSSSISSTPPPDGETEGEDKVKNAVEDDAGLTGTEGEGTREASVSDDETKVDDATEKVLAEASEPKQVESAASSVDADASAAQETLDPKN